MLALKPENGVHAAPRTAYQTQTDLLRPSQVDNSHDNHNWRPTDLVKLGGNLQGLRRMTPFCL